MCVAAGSSKSLVAKAKAETNPNRVLNFIPDDKMGRNFNELSPVNKSAIRSTLNLRKADVEYLDEYKGRGDQTSSLRIGGEKYTVKIAMTETGNVNYSLTKGRKNIVKDGSYQNVANQLATLINRK